MRRETRSSSTRDELRCNHCGSLYSDAAVTENEGHVFCVCGGKVWYRSRVTLPERFALWMGWIERADESRLREIGGDVPLGGKPGTVAEAFKALQENENGK